MQQQDLWLFLGMNTREEEEVLFHCFCQKPTVCLLMVVNMRILIRKQRWILKLLFLLFVSIPVLMLMQC